MDRIEWDKDKYRALVNLIDQGFFVIDVIFDETDKPIDMYYVEANEAATRMLGLDFTGKRLHEIDPNYEEYWFEIFGDVALTGQSVRMERYAEPDKKWYSFYIFKIGDEGSRRVGNIFLDITERKQMETLLGSNAILQAINRVYEKMVSCGTMAQMGDACLEIIGNATQSAISYIGETDADGFLHDIAVNGMGWRPCRTDEEAGHGKPPENSEMIDLCGDILHRGKTLIINEPYDHPDRAGAPEGHSKISAFLGAPFVRNGKVIGMIAVANREGGYTEKEKVFLEAVTPTVMEALLHKRADEALRESERKYRDLFDSIDEGFCIVEVLFDGHDRPLDYRFLEVNKSFERQTGLVDAEGRRMRDMAPEHEQHWFDIYGHIALTGEPVRFQDPAVALGRFYDVYAFRVGKPEQRRVAILFTDINERKRAEEALRDRTRELEEENRQKEDILESVSDCFYALDKDLRFTYVNKTAEELWGLQRADLMGRRIGSVFSGLIDISLSKFWRVLEEQVSLHYEVYSKVAQRWGDMSVYPTRNGISVYFHDITERKKAEEILKMSKERQAFLLKLSDALRFDPDTGSILSRVSCILAEHLMVSQANYAEYHEDSGYSVIQHENHTDAGRSLIGNHKIDDYSFVVDILRTGSVLDMPDVLSFPGMPEDQRARLAGLGFRAHLSVPLIKDGVLAATLTIRQDTPRIWKPEEVSLLLETAERIWAAVERAKAEEALRESRAQLKEELGGARLLQGISTELLYQKNAQEFYEKIIDTAADIMHAQFASIQMLSPNGDKQERLKLLAYRGFNQVAAEFWKYVDITSGSSCAEALRSGKRIIVSDIEHCDFAQGTKDQEIYLQTGIHASQTTPLYSRGGRPVGMISTHWSRPYIPSENELRLLDVLARQAADVIDRRQFEEALQESEKKANTLVRELEKADKNKNEFMGVLSHELRNPLAAISAGIQLLDVTRDANQAGKAKEIMKRQMNQLCKLVDDLLDLTRITQNKIKLKKESVHLNEIAWNAIEDMRPEFEKKGVALGMEIQPQPIFLNADPVRITQIIGNVLMNALKFTPANGAVQLTLRAEESNVVIRVQDNGIGISAQILPHLFTPFTQAESTLDRGMGGLGLGLSIVKGIVDLHGGSVQAYSEGLGKGSTFTIRLPIAAEKPLSAEQRASGGDAQKRLKLLIIEDNRDFAELIGSMLGVLGHEISIASDGMEGVEKAKALIPDVIFCDIGLPEINGFEVARRIKADPNLRNVSMIALTGYARDFDVELAKRAGFKRHMAKPVEMAALETVFDDLSQSEI